jgi:glycosyltransferase involved in cell wall biosynthesis
LIYIQVYKINVKNKSIRKFIFSNLNCIFVSCPNCYFLVVVPTYNRAHLITDTLISLTNQEFKNYEIIIVDDGSTDNTAEVIKAPFLSDARISYYKKNNAERAAARNFGAAKAKGEFMSIFLIVMILHYPITLSVGEVKSSTRKTATQNGFTWPTLGQRWVGSIRNKVNNFKGETLNDIICDGNSFELQWRFYQKRCYFRKPISMKKESLSASEDYDLMATFGCDVFRCIILTRLLH